MPVNREDIPDRDVLLRIELVKSWSFSFVTTINMGILSQSSPVGWECLVQPEAVSGGGVEARMARERGGRWR